MSRFALSSQGSAGETDDRGGGVTLPAGAPQCPHAPLATGRLHSCARSPTSPNSALQWGVPCSQSFWQVGPSGCTPLQLRDSFSFPAMTCPAKSSPSRTRKKGRARFGGTQSHIPREKGGGSPPGGSRVEFPSRREERSQACKSCKRAQFGDPFWALLPGLTRGLGIHARVPEPRFPGRSWSVSCKVAPKAETRGWSSSGKRGVQYVYVCIYVQEGGDPTAPHAPWSAGEQ